MEVYYFDGSEIQEIFIDFWDFGDTDSLDVDWSALEK